MTLITSTFFIFLSFFSIINFIVLKKYKKKVDNLKILNMEKEIEKTDLINNLKKEKKDKEVDKLHDDFIKKLTLIAERNDAATKNHIYRVGALSALFAEKLGQKNEFINDIKKFSPLHDIGKIFVSDLILNKSYSLTSEEFEEIKKHTIYSEIFFDDNYYKMAKNISLYHHEKFDGSGYPFKLKGNQIPLEAQIVSIVDVYDALRSLRVYKKPFNHNISKEILLKGDHLTKPSNFNPELLNIFEKYSEEFNRLYNKMNGN